jgi:DNA adenine methylase
MEKELEMAVALAPELDESSEAKPFVKWVGGKRQLIPELVRHAPKRDQIATYYEPFVGGGALFFHLRPRRAVLTDFNERLIRAYRGVRDDVEGVIDRLRTYSHLHDRHFFGKMRGLDVDRLREDGDAGVAAWFIYLNRTGYNGLYRVNSRNVFNVPFGDYKKPMICDVETLRACSRVLQRATKGSGDAEDGIRVADFEDVARRAVQGDFVYFDPPYAPLNATSKFTDYTSAGFGDEQQLRLRNLVLDLKRAGIRVLLSNSSADRVLAWYPKKDFHRIRVDARRAVNSKPDARGSVSELLIY